MFAAQQQQPRAHKGDDLPSIVTDNIGFKAVAGETKIRLLPEPWPSDSLPKPTSSLLSVASRSELVAAAGPNKLVIGSTSAIRNAFAAGAGAPSGGPAEDNFKPFTPELSLDTPRISQVAFSSDENSLVISAEEGGGLAVYDVQSLKQGSTTPAFQVATNGVAVRALVPNPSSEFAHRFAVVLAGGQLLMADLKERSLSHGPNGAVMKEGVSCVSWSAKGKQLVAGLGDGSAVQMEPDGTVKAQIPRYPQLQGDQHVSGISWLDNDHFLVIYSPSNVEVSPPPDSTFVYISREPKTTNFLFQTVDDPVLAFGMNRTPQHHFVCRLRNFPPSLTDTLVIASTESCDVGLITCSANPLSADAANTANKYTKTTISDDTRQAQLPSYTNKDGNLVETSPIGLALDLSSKEPVNKPIPSDEMDASSTPLPNLLALNNEGVLSSWWFVYADSIKARTAFPGLVAVASNQQQPPATPQQSSGFGLAGQPQSSFGSPNPLGSNAFGQRPAPSFGTPTAPTAAAGNAFGGSGPLGGSKSPWTSTGGAAATPQTGITAFGKPAFGSSTPVGAGGGFGAVGGIGSRPSPWATSAQNQQSENKLANPFSNASASSPFASIGQQPSDGGKDKPPLSAFGSTSGASGFANLGQQNNKPLFGAVPTSSGPGISNQPSFGSTVTIGSNFGSSFGGPSTIGEPKSAWGTPSLSNNPSAGSGNKGLFGSAPSLEANMTSGDMDNDMDTQDQPQADAKKPADGSFGLFSDASSGFKLGSTFKPDDNVAPNDDSKPSGSSMFGDAFGKALGDTQQSTPKSTTGLSFAPKDSDNQKDKEKSAVSNLFASNANQVSSEHPPKASNSLFSNVKSEAKDTNATSKLTTPVSPQDESRPAPLSAKADSDSSWEKVQKSPNDGDEDIESAPLPPSPSTIKSQRGDDYLPPLPLSNAGQKQRAEQQDPTTLPPSPPSPTFPSLRSITLAGQRRKESESAHPPSPPLQSSLLVSRAKQQEAADTSRQSPASTFAPTREAQSADPPLPPGEAPFTSIRRLEATDPPLPPSQPSSTATQEQSSDTPLPPLPLSSTPARPQQGQGLFSTTPVAPPPRSPSPRKSHQFHNILSTTPTAPPPLKSGTSSRSVSRPVFQTSSRTTSREERTTQSRARSEAEQGAIDEYVDDSDFRIQEELMSDIEPTTHLASFIAHQDYAGKVPGQGVGAQIERVYRDIQSMIDTLGLNARSLKAFLAGHEGFKDGGRTREDLEQGREDDWCLIEIADLGTVEKEIANSLEARQLQNVGDMVADLQDMQKSVTKLRSRHHNLQHVIRSLQPVEGNGESRDRNDDDVRNSLTAEQSVVLHELRRAFTEFQKYLAQAEDSLTMLRAKVASIQTSSDGHQFGSPSKAPTFEAVTNTISKMTRMVEQKSGDVDVLEAQLRKLRSSPDRNSTGASANLDEVLGRLTLGPSTSGEQSRFRTPPSSRGRVAGGSPGTFHLSYESGSDNGSFDSPTKASPGANKGTRAQPQVSQEEVRAYSAMVARREKVLGLFKKKICERGTYIQGP